MRFTNYRITEKEQKDMLIQTQSKIILLIYSHKNKLVVAAVIVVAALTQPYANMSPKNTRLMSELLAI